MCAYEPRTGYVSDLDVSGSKLHVAICGPAPAHPRDTRAPNTRSYAGYAFADMWSVIFTYTGMLSGP